MGLVSFCIYFITLSIYFGTWEWSGTYSVAQTGLKLMSLLLQLPEIIGMYHRTRPGVGVWFIASVLRGSERTAAWPDFVSLSVITSSHLQDASVLVSGWGVKAASGT